MRNCDVPPEVRVFTTLLRSPCVVIADFAYQVPASTVQTLSALLPLQPSHVSGLVPYSYSYLLMDEVRCQKGMVWIRLISHNHWTRRWSSRSRRILFEAICTPVSGAKCLSRSSAIVMSLVKSTHVRGFGSKHTQFGINMKTKRVVGGGVRDG